VAGTAGAGAQGGDHPVLLYSNGHAPAQQALARPTGRMHCVASRPPPYASASIPFLLMCPLWASFAPFSLGPSATPMSQRGRRVCEKTLTKVVWPWRWAYWVRWRRHPDVGVRRDER
jgi:hypothetical protein